MLKWRVIIDLIGEFSIQTTQKVVRERALSTYQLLSHRGLCQYTENGVTEWLLFLNLSTLSTYQNYSYRVLCEVCCIWVTEYSVSYGKIDLQSNL